MPIPVKTTAKTGWGDVWNRVKYVNRFDHSATLLAYSGTKFNSFLPPSASYVSSMMKLAIGSNELLAVWDNKIG